MPPAPLARPRRFRWGAILVSALFLLVTMWAGLAVTQLVEDFFTRSPLLGWIALGVAGIAALAAVVIIAREIWALARLRRIEHIQVDAAHAINADDCGRRQARDRPACKSLYAARADAQLGLKELKQYESDIMDGRDRMKLAERHLVSWRDAEAHRIIAHAARRITLLTTVAPTARPRHPLRRRAEPAHDARTRDALWRQALDARHPPACPHGDRAISRSPAASRCPTI